MEHISLPGTIGIPAEKALVNDITSNELLIINLVSMAREIPAERNSNSKTIKTRAHLMKTGPLFRTKTLWQLKKQLRLHLNYSKKLNI